MMADLIILGTGSLGRHVLQRALASGHDVAVVARDPSRLPADVRGRVSTHAGDLRDLPVAEVIRGHDALINCAGNVADGSDFVELVDRLVTCMESLHPTEVPVSWFLAGAALLDIDASGRRGVDMPQLGATYWPHRANFERLRRSSLTDWRMLCPGPMVDEPPLGVERLRISIDRLPTEPPVAKEGAADPELLWAFTSLIPEMMVPYPDAANLMLGDLDRGSATGGHRVGLALPAGIRGWGPRPSRNMERGP